MAEGDNIGFTTSDFNMPKWKKDLIERRKITTKTISGNLQISCPTSAKFINSNLGFKGCFNLLLADGSVKLGVKRLNGIIDAHWTKTSARNSLEAHQHLDSAKAISNKTNPTVSTSTVSDISSSTISLDLAGHSLAQTNTNANNEKKSTIQSTAISSSSPTYPTKEKPNKNNFELNDVETPFLQSHSSSHGSEQLPVNFSDKKNVICLDEQNECLIETKSSDKIKLNLQKFNLEKSLEKVKNMVAAEDNLIDDTSEELQYGPGIVSKLRCRYLSLALRQSASKRRPSLSNLRKATSLNNLLDDEEEDEEELEEPERKRKSSAGHIHKVRTPDEYISPFQRQDCELKEKRSRHIHRGNESLKRARSVEAIMKYDNKAWEADIAKENQVQDNLLILDEIQNGFSKKEIVQQPQQQEEVVVTIETKIINGRERGDPKPKRLVSYLDETEIVKDVVKTKLRIFEATANRRVVRNNLRGDVANKVASYKTIISNEKPAIIFPKPPLSPKKPAIKPRSTSPLRNLNLSKQTTVPSTLINRSMSPLTVKVDLGYRTNKLDSPSPMSPNNFAHSITNNTANVVVTDSPIIELSRKNVFNNSTILESPTITQLSNKLKKLVIESPTQPQQQQKSKQKNQIDVQDDEQIDEIKLATNSIKKLNGTSDLQQNGKQIGVIRPLPADPKYNSFDVVEDCVNEIKKDYLLKNDTNYKKPILTTQEIEKNLINSEKSIKDDVVDGAVETVQTTKWAVRKKQQQPQNNTMVFNFSDRKDVPDYIENDGLILRRKKELPKPGESGFVILGHAPNETSTDDDHDSWSMGPPSPCDVEFINWNIIIDGKSNLKIKVKEIKSNIHFDDCLTTTFEYPSESSLLADNDYGEEYSGSYIDGVISEANQKLIGTMPLGSAPLGSYTPVKAAINSSFELGITRGPQTTTILPLIDQNGSNGEESNSLQYLKPATDDQTVAWSENTRVTDLLF